MTTPNNTVAGLAEKWREDMDRNIPFHSLTDDRRTNFNAGVAHCMRDLKRAALASSAPASAWRPIAEAPRDGTEILAWDGEDRFVTKWCTFRDGFGESYTGWIEPNAGELGPWPCEPILFQPLPTPPTSTKGG